MVNNSENDKININTYNLPFVCLICLFGLGEGSIKNNIISHVIYEGADRVRGRWDMSWREVGGMGAGGRRRGGGRREKRGREEGKKGAGGGRGRTKRREGKVENFERAKRAPRREGKMETRGWEGGGKGAGGGEAYPPPLSTPHILNIFLVSVGTCKLKEEVLRISMHVTYSGCLVYDSWTISHWIWPLSRSVWFEPLQRNNGRKRNNSVAVLGQSC